MQGGKDPFNRGTYPWREVDPELRNWYCRLGQLRKESECLQRGYLKTLYAKDGVYVYARYFEKGKDPFGAKGKGVAICVVNRDAEEREVVLHLPEELQGEMRETLTDEKKVLGKEVSLQIPALSAKLFIR